MFNRFFFADNCIYFNAVKMKWIAFPQEGKQYTEKSFALTKFTAVEYCI